VVAAVVVVLLGDALIKGALPVAARTAGIGALVVWVAWMLLVRPSIRVLPDRAVVVNVGRITEVPWARVVDIRRRLQLVLDLDDGRRVEGWGSPFAPRKHTAEDSALTALRSAWQAAPAGSPAAVVRRADGIALLIGAVAIVAFVAGVAAAQ
jgi:hypothetical protein